MKTAQFVSTFLSFSVGGGARRPSEHQAGLRAWCVLCVCKWLQQNNSLTCPCCYADHFSDFTTIRQAPPLVVSMVESLCVVCTRCSSHVELKAYNHHLCQPCPSQHQVVSHSSIDDLLHQPLTAPLTPIEQKLQTSLARRSLTVLSRE